MSGPGTGKCCILHISLTYMYMYCRFEWAKKPSHATVPFWSSRIYNFFGLGQLHAQILSILAHKALTETALTLTKRQQRRHLVSVRFKVRQKYDNGTLFHTRVNDAPNNFFRNSSFKSLAIFQRVPKTKQCLRWCFVRLIAVSVDTYRD